MGPSGLHHKQNQYYRRRKKAIKIIINNVGNYLSAVAVISEMRSHSQSFEGRQAVECAWFNIRQLVEVQIPDANKPAHSKTLYWRAVFYGKNNFTVTKHHRKAIVFEYLKQLCIAIIVDELYQSTVNASSTYSCSKFVRPRNVSTSSDLRRFLYKYLHNKTQMTRWHCTDSVYSINQSMYSVSQKNPPYGFLKFFPKRLGIFNQFFTHLLHDHFYTRVQSFVQISPTLTKLCNTKRDHLAKFYISLEL